ncbi:hypothetical protein [Halorarius litoreus]|uniref:hypothetical protein n=1 Tax=Halorarius litoreus TaxID=2962676 RepID=UPI0020CF65A3|nr:hypothetical protein [Halorarius litoreus]
MTARRRLVRALVLVPALLALPVVGRALAHGGSLGGSAGRSLDIPTWLFLATGGGVVGASFLLSSFATDRAFIQQVHARQRALTVPVRTLVVSAGRVLGVLGLVGVVAVGFLGPTDPLRNAAVLVVWAGWWAGLAMTAYLVGNAWPVLNPWRTLARFLPTRNRPLRVDGAWLSTVGLLALVWLEVVSPLADAPRLLAVVVVGYSAVALAGYGLLGDAYFETVDPVSRVFRYYGAVAPVERGPDGVRLRLPGTGLDDDILDGSGDVAFVIALLWGTTFDGLVATPPWANVARAVVGAGVPAALLYPAALLVGFGVFFAAYVVAVRYGARYAETRLDEATLARRFAPSLLAIAAGYHLAHYLGYFLSLSPALVGALVDPLSPGQAYTLVLPGWFGGLSLAFVLLGHVLAVWVAHAVAYELFPSRMQAIRSQYALTLVMVFYTMTSLWIVSRPYAAPPFV